jgi:dihydroorotase (multifunctional complex type)
MHVDVAIRGGQVHSSAGANRVDILIEDGKIAGLVAPGAEVDATRVIDADGLDILPGLVDLHAHTRTPGMEHKEDFRTVSEAAAVGGVTTWVDMPNVDPPTVSAELLAAKRDMASRDVLVDWGHFVSGSRPEAVAELAAAGATGYKIFMVGGGYPHDDRIAVVANDTLYAALEAVATTGLPCLVHPFEQSLFNLFWKRALAEGRPPDHTTRVEVYTGIDIVWRSAVATLLEFQKETDVRLHVLHTHAAGSIDLIRKAKAEGSRVVAALDPKYFHLTRADMERLGPRSYSGAVITERPEQLAKIWDAVRDGTIDYIDSDHGPHGLEEIERARVDASKAELGNPQYDNLLSILLNDVNSGKIEIADIVRLLCENPAKLIGYYPEKGTVSVGADADLVLVDMTKSIEIRDEDVKSKAGWTPYAGWKVKGGPVITVSRGEVIAQNGATSTDYGRGRYLAGRPRRWARLPVRTGPGLALEPR